MKRKLSLVTAALTVISIYIYLGPAVSTAFSGEGHPDSSTLGPQLADSPHEVVYDFDRCGLCHAVPEIAKRELGVEEKQQCDACHGEIQDNVLMEDVVEPVQVAELEGPGPYPSPGSDPRHKKILERSRKHVPEGLGSMAYIPAGEFTQGTNIRHADEGPEHKVTLGGYYLDKYEVTNIQYKKFVDDTGYKKPVHWVTGSYPAGKEYHPVVYVSMFDGKAYCDWAGKRLPTESEWEKGARGTDARIHPWGNEFDETKGNVVLLGLKQTTAVGTFEEGKSPYGLYDMVGNVWEWTTTWFYPYEGSDIPKKDEYYANKVVTLKGGSWFNCHAYDCGMSAYTFNRSQFSPRVRNSSFGFRCARDDDGKGAGRAK